MESSIWVAVITLAFQHSTSFLMIVCWMTGHTLQRNLHAHIASRDHDAVRRLYNLINVVHPLLILDLRNNIDVSAAILIQKQAHLADVFGSAGK